MMQEAPETYKKNTQFCPVIIRIQFKYNFHCPEKTGGATFSYKF